MPTSETSCLIKTSDLLSLNADWTENSQPNQNWWKKQNLKNLCSWSVRYGRWRLEQSDQGSLDYSFVYYVMVQAMVGRKHNLRISSYANIFIRNAAIYKFNFESLCNLPWLWFNSLKLLKVETFSIRRGAKGKKDYSTAVCNQWYKLCNLLNETDAPRLLVSSLGWGKVVGILLMHFTLLAKVPQMF